MYRQIFTLFRGAAFTAAETFSDRNALLILQQQLRDCAHAVTSARTAVAVAMAQHKQEIQQCALLSERLLDLEERAIAAIQQEKHSLAQEAAATIAQLEAECVASRQAQAEFEQEISRLRANVRRSETRLREIERGYRLATATDRTQRLRETLPDGGISNLAEAEATLSRLRNRQQRIDLTAEALAELDATGNPARMSEKLAAAGCGKPLSTSAGEVLARLGERARSDAKQASNF